MAETDYRALVERLARAAIGGIPMVQQARFGNALVGALNEGAETSREAAAALGTLPPSELRQAPANALYPIYQGAIQNMMFTPLGVSGKALGSGPVLPRSSLPMDEASRMARAKEQAYTLDAYHGTRSPNDFSQFETGPIYDDAGNLLHASSGDPNAFLGPHFAKEPAVANKFAGNTVSWMQRSRFDEGAPRVMPMRLNAKNVHKFDSEEALNNHIYDHEVSTPEVDYMIEDRAGGDLEAGSKKYESDPEFRRSINEQAVQNELSLDEPSHETAQALADAARRGFDARGVTTIQYPNAVEGGTSYISLAPPRSRFAAFDPANAESGYILGAGPTKNNPLIHAISAVKLTRPISEMEATYKAPDIPIMEKAVTPADLQGGYLIPAFGDRSRAGGFLTSVSGEKLKTPVPLQGGHQYMPAHSERGAVWASDPGVITRLENKAAPYLEQGKPVYLPYTAMAADAVDYSHHVWDTLSQLAKQADISGRTEKMFNAKMRKPGAGYAAEMRDFPGIKSSELYDWLSNAAGDERNKFAHMLDSRTFMDKGLPNVAEVRTAVTDPRLLDVPWGSSGLSISQYAPLGGARVPSLHDSYIATLLGKYRGGLGGSVPPEVMFPDVWPAIQSSSKSPMRAFTMRLTEQPTNQQWVDTVSQYLLNQRKAAPASGKP